MRFCWIILLSGSLGLKAQSFHRAAVIMQAGTGLDVYKTEQRYDRINSLTDTMIQSIAVSKNLYGALEIGLGKHIGIGARGRFNSFFRDVDNVIRQKASVNSAEVMFALNIHPIVTKRFDLVLGGEAGMSNIDLSFESLNKNTSSGRGTCAAVYIEPRFYKRRFGFHVRASLPVVKYRNLSAAAENINQQKFAISDWKGSGFGLSFGFQLRLF